MPDLKTVYRDYLTALDERRFEDLRLFVHDELTYNEAPMTRDEYAAMIADDVRRIPDLRFEPRLVVVSGDVLACRLWFACTPELEFAGIAPSGAPVSFAEHVFYRFREHRIEQVWSLLDLDALRAQAAGRADA